MTSDPDILVAGHLCLDIVPEFLPDAFEVEARIEPGTLKVIGPASCVTGGCVSNTGLTLHQLGIRTSLMGKIGDDPFGDQILDLVRRVDNLLADGMIIASGGNTSYSIVISPPGIDRSFFHCPGANDTFAADDIQMEQFGSAKIFHFGYPPLMERFWNDGGAEMEKLFRRAKECGPMTSLDMAMPDPTNLAGQIDWNTWLERVLPHVDLFLPSIDEILFMLNPVHYRERVHENKSRDAEFLESDLLAATADRLISFGVGIVVLKLGSHGLYLKTSSDERNISNGFYSGKSHVEQWVGRELYAPCFEVEVASTNGAGDRTIAGFLAALARDADPDEALLRAVAVGAASVESLNPAQSMVSLEDIDKRIYAGWNRRKVEGKLSEEFTCQESGCWKGKHGR